ncbi:hypothetical protein Tco_1099747 [Tanacetum coccineum]
MYYEVAPQCCIPLRIVVWGCYNDCEIRYHPGMANVVADALSRKERVKPKRVRAMNMILQSKASKAISLLQQPEMPVGKGQLTRKFHNSIMKDKMEYKGDNVVGALMNVPIFVGTFSVMTDFAVLEDMSAYRDEEMGDVIVGEPFLREV